MTGLGFACISKSLKENGRFRTMSVKTYNNLKPDERMRRLRAITVDNLYNTYRIILWCIENSISLYRLSSDLIPLAVYIREWEWWEDRDIRNMCEKIKKIVDEGNIRISMHPDQFCVLNSDRAEVVKGSIAILEHHNKLSNMVGNRILVIHAGSGTGGKSKAIERFIKNFNMLDEDIKKKIAIENDDKVFNAEDVLYLCEHLGVPMVLDIHHHKCNHEKDNLPQLMDRIKSTWNGKRPKVHLSSGKTCPTDRHHADYIDFEDYRQTAELVKDEFDIMMECKEKDLAVLKIMNKASSELS
ncbi:MAG TPA: UV DNA damage repair endonuclease UvsE [Candidatus Diapherotrites archaeon]|nr:UV DNA damage repair endonuclease UvsE [Candidatus Diapherotrites archaeon]